MNQDQMKALVWNQVRHDLETYWQEAQEHEDPETLNNPDVKKRVQDFYLYQYEVTR